MDNYYSAVLGIMFGGYLIIISINRYSRLSKLVENGVETKGVITFTKKSSRLLNDAGEESYKTVYYPVVEYADEKGNKVVNELEGEFSTSKDEFNTGDSIDLIYDKDKPHIAMRKSTVEWKWIPLIPLTLGVLVFAYCTFILIESFNN